MIKGIEFQNNEELQKSEKIQLKIGKPDAKSYGNFFTCVNALFVRRACWQSIHNS